MGLGKTFTRAIVREIGRNYGKAASNHLLGDKHSTPIRMVRGSQDVSRKRGRVYDNDYDKALKKFEIKGAQATFTQVLNIHSEYFSLVEEANADNVIDLNEMSFLVQELPKGISVLERAKSALIDFDKKDLADKTQEKIDSLKEFMISLDKALVIENLPSVKFNPIAFLCFFLSFIGLDRIYFKPKNFWSYFYAVIGISFPYWIITGDGVYGQPASELSTGILIYSVLSLSMPFWYGMLLNPIKTGGYHEYIENKKLQKENNKWAVEIKKYTATQIAKF
jgi:hypothetical protein